MRAPDRTVAVACMCGLLAAACDSEESAVLRGDRYWADSNFVAALAEYRLAARQSDRPEIEARVAHAYMVTGQLERARARYDALIQAEPSYADQAVYDYVWLARSSLQRGDRYGAARAAEAALQLRPGLALPELTLTLARHYATIGDADRALQHYQRAAGSDGIGSRPALLYEIANLTERSQPCEQALPYFRAFTQETASADSALEVRWRMGTCGLERGRQAREAGDPARALELLAIPIELGAPQNLLDQAWFERGEALMALARPDEARLSFERVLELGTNDRSPQALRARRRLEDLGRTPIDP